MTAGHNARGQSRSPQSPGSKNHQVHQQGLGKVAYGRNLDTDLMIGRCTQSLAVSTRVTAEVTARPPAVGPTQCVVATADDGLTARRLVPGISAPLIIASHTLINRCTCAPNVPKCSRLSGARLDRAADRSACIYVRAAAATGGGNVVYGRLNAGSRPSGLGRGPAIGSSSAIFIRLSGAAPGRARPPGASGRPASRCGCRLAPRRMRGRGRRRPR
jgi:hypothetical protein